MNKLIIASLLSLMLTFHLNAQLPSNNVSNFNQNETEISFNNDSSLVVVDSLLGPWDHLTINSDSRINKLLEIKKEESIRKGGIDGYRLQIYQGTKKEAYRVKARFLSMYPTYNVELDFDTPPDFRVRVGDFRSKSEVVKLKYLVEKDFPNPLIVPDVINFPRLLSE